MRTRTRLIMDSIIGAAGLLIVYVWDWPIEAIGAAGIAWTLLDCVTMLRIIWRPRK